MLHHVFMSMHAESVMRKRVCVYKCVYDCMEMCCLYIGLSIIITVVSKEYVFLVSSTLLPITSQ